MAEAKAAATALDEFGENLANASILVIDDEPGMRNFLTKTLSPRCKRVEQCKSAIEASKILDHAHFDLIILDNIMPGISGLDWTRQQNQVGLFADTILITAYADLETVISALRVGVADFLLKPFRANQILNAVARALDRKNLRRENSLLRHALQGETHAVGGRLLGKSAAISRVRNILEKLAPLPTPVLLTGQSGTGKEVAARTLHSLSERADKPFVTINCATISPENMARELFGEIDAHERKKDGLFLHADGGTLFLDEIAQMPETVQTAMLRVLDDHRIRPIGAEREIPLDIRILCATNADLEQKIEDGQFRADLYHRINVMRIDMPNLSDREDDIVELAALFMGQFSRSLGMPALTLDEETLLKMRRYDWPGNVRELRNLIERSVILGAFPEAFSGSGAITGAPAVETLDLVMQRHIVHVLDACSGNRAEAARRLGVSRKTIDRKCVSWGI